jgi:predicted nucleic acid-binding protein
VTTVVDASVVIAALVGTDDTGEWAESLLLEGQLAAPHLLPAEVASMLRRAVQSGDLSTDLATLAYADLLDLRIQLYPYAPFSVRVWELRDNVTPYDAWYVALAEFLEVPIATLDGKLAKAARTRCEFLMPTG